MEGRRKDGWIEREIKGWKKRKKVLDIQSQRIQRVKSTEFETDNLELQNTKTKIFTCK